MTVELKMLVFASVLLFAIIMVQATASMRVHGPAKLGGNRDDLGPPSAYEGRVKRVVANHIENLVIFAPLLLVAVAAQLTGHLTALAAQLFFWGRLAHAILYLAGVAYVRTLAAVVSTAGLVILMLVDLKLV